MSGQDTIQQEERVMPKDSLPDLWVITLDISGSMKGEQKYSKIPDGFKAIVEKNGGNKTNNRFILLGSGMTFDELRSSHEGFAKKFDLHYVENDFTSILIKSLSEITNYNDVCKVISRLCRDSSHFNYDRSFASIARPLSIHYLTKKKHLDLLNYNAIYHIQITDNGDKDDQWGKEYHLLRVHRSEEHTSELQSQ